MAKLFTAVKDCLDGSDITIEIHTTAAGTDSNNTFIMAMPYPEITRNGTKDVYDDPIVATTFNFAVHLDTTTTTIENWILNELIVDTPFTYYVKYFKNGSMKYRGWILTDQVSIEDADYPYSFQIRCTDALGVADKFPYAIKTGGALDGQAFSDLVPFPLLTHLNLAMNATGVRDLYDAGEEYVATSVRWFETNWSVITDDPVRMTQVSHAAFYKSDEVQTAEDDDVDRYRAADDVDNCREVLTKICKLFNARMYQQDGYYHLVQIQEMDNAVLNKFYYEKTTDIVGNLTKLRQETSGNQVTEGKDLGYIIRRPGGSYQFQDPVSYVHVKHTLTGSQNLTRQLRFYDLTRENWGDRETKEGLFVNLVQIDNTANARIRVYLRIRHNAIKNTAGGIVTNWPSHFIKFRLTLQVGNYYYKRAALKMNDAEEWEYSDGAWSAGLGYCEIVSKPNQQAWTYAGFGFENWTTTIVDFTTAEVIPEKGPLNIQFQDYETITNAKIDRVEENYTTATSIIPITLFSTYSLPDLTALSDDEVNKIIKVQMKQGGTTVALTYKSGILDADDQFQISGANLVLNKPFSAITTKVTWHDHGAALAFPWNDDSYYRVNYDTEEFSISVESDDPERNTSDQDYYSYIGENDLDNKIFLSEEIKMGDLPRTESKHKLMWYDTIGLEWKSTDLWSNNGTGSDRLLQYKADDHAAFKNVRKRFVLGQFTSFNTSVDWKPELRIIYEGIIYMLCNGTEDIVRNTMDGTWIEVGREFTGVTSKSSGLIRVGRVYHRPLANTNREIPLLTNRDGITRTDAELEAGIITEVSIQPLYEKFLKAGSQVEIMDPNQKYSQTLTITEDASPGATTLKVADRIDYTFAEGSMITLKVAASGTLTGGWEEAFTGQTGTTYTVTGGTLPSELGLTDEQLNKKIEVYRNGIRQWYNSSAADYDEYYITAASNLITFVYPLAAADKVFIKVI